MPIRRSVAHDRIGCLECGARMAMLKRHLATAHDLTPEAYRERWGLGRDYPMVAPDYAEVRSGLAKRAGLGRGGRRGGQAGGEREVEPAAAPDTADAEPPAIMTVEFAAPAPKTGRGRKRGSPTSPEEAPQPEPEARADAPEDAAPAENVTPGTPAPASGGRGRRRATKGTGLT